jgi:chemotaxis protein methyltransferase CheR
LYPLNDKDFNYISSAVYDYARINLTEKKRALIVSRLSKRIRLLNLNSFTEYTDYLKNDSSGNEFQTMVDSLSTNYSLFFREPHHFDFFRDTILKPHSSGELNIWSAASSTGQEVYSVLMTIKEFQLRNNRKIRYRLFASDISRQVLEIASSGIYNNQDIKKIPRQILENYFLKGSGNQRDMVKIKKDLIRDIKFFRLNLNDKSYQLPQMDVIFLRNAIIYFDQPTKVELINRLHRYIKPGGYLILGHSESLSGISDKFQLIGKTIYKRKDV